MAHSQDILDVTLIATVFNEISSIDAMMNSFWKMTHLPKEFVIVDGGSSDGTIERLREWKIKMEPNISLVIIVDDKCNKKYHPSPIALGRNIAIKNASYPVIAATDAGCVLHASWLIEIAGPLLHDPTVDVVAGWNEVMAIGFFERCQAIIAYRPPSTVDPDSFLPSSRSIAFRKNAWTTVGGYPEISLAGEDTLFDLRIREFGLKIIFAPTAIVYWRMRPDFYRYVQLIYRYGFGDGFGRLLPMNCVKNSLKVSGWLFFLGSSFFLSKWFLIPFCIYLWLLPFVFKLREAFRIKMTFMYPVVSFLKIVWDITYVVGYLKGMSSEQQPAFLRVRDFKKIK
jgi:glycosyltransferase involved in cell wall biosynthesis